MKTSVPAYPETYLDDAMRTLGDAVDWASVARRADPDRFFAAFVTSGLADSFGAGVPKIVAGLSGAELAEATFRKIGEGSEDFDDSARAHLRAGGETPEFWVGWIMAYYQWSRAIPFREIIGFLPAGTLLKLYPTLHEASEERCAATFDSRRQHNGTISALATARKAAGLTQSELAHLAGVSLRGVQQWEQGCRGLDRAAAGSVAALARVLGLPMQSLLQST